MSERWLEIKSIFVRALEAPPGERAAIVRTACAGDDELKREVESLLAAAAQADSIPEARAAIASAAGAIVAEQQATLRSALEGVLGSQYEIIRELGRGGMATVYLAKERALERYVAIKVLRPDLAMSESHRERFRREARIAASLSHPGILGLHSFGEIDNLWYFVMTYVRGETLAERIQREGLLPWADAHRIFLEVADALETAHKNGVVHRDIKPANILLDSESGRAILGDFGISKMPGLSESLTAPGAIMGTPSFMSPEQLAGSGDIDERSDIYSLGSVVYLMLTGRPPFGEPTDSSTIYRRLAEEPTPAGQIVPSVPESLSAMVQKAIARDRNNRWANASALKTALASLVDADRMPDVVRDFRSFGPYALLWMAAFTVFAVTGAHSKSERALLLIAAVIAPLGLALHLYNTAGREVNLADIARASAFPPAWWTMWWPRSLRRPTDLWDRLPQIAKAVRIVISASFPALFVLILVREGVSVPAMPSSGLWVDAAEWGLLAFASTLVIGGLLWARRQGLSTDRALQLLLGATLQSPRWDDARIKRVLAPASGKVRAPDRDSPADYVRAIREMIALTGAENVDVAARAAETGDSLLQAINALEKHERELIHTMETRREVILREREELVERLRDLWVVVRDAGHKGGGD